MADHGEISRTQKIKKISNPALATVGVVGGLVAIALIYFLWTQSFPLACDSQTVVLTYKKIVLRGIQVFFSPELTKSYHDREDEVADAKILVRDIVTNAKNSNTGNLSCSATVTMNFQPQDLTDFGYQVVMGLHAAVQGVKQARLTYAVQLTADGKVLVTAYGQ